MTQRVGGEHLKPSFDPNLPIYTQLVDWFKQQILGGELSPGERVTPVRELALELGVNPNTLQRAMSELEREGLLYTERTAGRFVTSDSALITALREEMIARIVQRFLAELTALGCSSNDALQLIGKFGGEIDE